MQHCERSASHYFRIIPQPKEVTHTDYMVGTIRRKNTNVLYAHQVWASYVSTDDVDTIEEMFFFTACDLPEWHQWYEEGIITNKIQKNYRDLAKVCKTHPCIIVCVFYLSLSHTGAAAIV